LLLRKIQRIQLLLDLTGRFLKHLKAVIEVGRLLFHLGFLFFDFMAPFSQLLLFLSKQCLALLKKSFSHFFTATRTCRRLSPLSYRMVRLGSGSLYSSRLGACHTENRRLWLHYDASLFGLLHSRLEVRFVLCAGVHGNFDGGLLEARLSFSWLERLVFFDDLVFQISDAFLQFRKVNPNCPEAADFADRWIDRL